MRLLNLVSASLQSWHKSLSILRATVPMFSVQALSRGHPYFFRQRSHPLQMLAWTWMYPGHSHMLLEEDLSSGNGGEAKGEKDENHGANLY